MKKVSILIVCLCASLTFVCQAQDTGTNSASGGSPLDGLTKATIRPTGGDTPSLQRRPKDWDEPIPGPFPHHFGGLDEDGDDSLDPHSSVGKSLDGLEKGTVRPGSEPNLDIDGTYGTNRPREFDEPIVPIGPGMSPEQEMNGISLVTGMIDGLLSGSTDVPDLNGDGKANVDDVTTLIDRLLSSK